MVHGLETIIKLNKEAAAAAKKIRKRNKDFDTKQTVLLSYKKPSYYSARNNSEIIQIPMKGQDENYFHQYCMSDDPDV